MPKRKLKVTGPTSNVIATKPTVSEDTAPKSKGVRGTKPTVSEDTTPPAPKDVTPPKSKK